MSIQQSPKLIANGDRLAEAMTKRERIASEQMAGILANRHYTPPRRTRLDGMAQDAVAAADALLAELEKQA